MVMRGRQMSASFQKLEMCLPGPSPHPAYKQRKEHREAFLKVPWRSGEQGLLICIPLLTSSSENQLHMQIMVVGSCSVFE